MMEVVPSPEISHTAMDRLEQNQEDIDFVTDIHAKSKTRKTKKRRRTRHRPYSAKNFLGRPKINAPANTTQFLCEDKEDLGLDQLFSNENSNSVHGCTSNSESECSLNTSSSTVPPSPICESQRDNLSYLGNSYESDRFLTEDFERMYNDVRTDLLRNESVEVLSSRCIELESAIHNLQYLLQKETEKREQMEEIIILMQANAELAEENNRLRHFQEAQMFSQNSSPIHSLFVHETSDDNS